MRRDLTILYVILKVVAILFFGSYLYFTTKYNLELKKDFINNYTAQHQNDSVIIATQNYMIDSLKKEIKK